MITLPSELECYYNRKCPLYLFNGNLQIRGTSENPEWNNIFRYWIGEKAFYKRYISIAKADVLFGQDAYGDQYFIRNSIIYKLFCETDEIYCFEQPFHAWLETVYQDPEKYLSINPENLINPGKLLLAYPPFCMKESKNCKIKEIALDEVIEFHAELAGKIRNLKNGEKIEINFD